MPRRFVSYLRISTDRQGRSGFRRQQHPHVKLTCVSARQHLDSADHRPTRPHHVAAGGPHRNVNVFSGAKPLLLLSLTAVIVRPFLAHYLVAVWTLSAFAWSASPVGLTMRVRTL